MLSTGTGLLAIQFGQPRRWQVIHARSGVSPAYLATSECRPWTRLRHSHLEELDLPRGVVERYLAGLEGIPAVDGTVINWTADLANLTRQLDRWHDLSDTREPARSHPLYTGMTGLHHAALFHAISPDPHNSASSNAVHQAVTMLTGRVDQLLVRGRPAQHVFDKLQDLDTYYDRGRRRRHDHDSRTRSQLRLDRDTGAVVTLARLYAWSGEPHRAVDLLRDRAAAVGMWDSDREDGLGSRALILAAQQIITLFSPAPTELEQLRGAQAGDLLIEPATTERDRTPPERIWRIITPAHNITTTPAGVENVENFDVLLHDEDHNQVACAHLRPAHPNPIRIDHVNASRWGHHTPNAGWALWPAGVSRPATSAEVLAVAADAARAFNADRPR